MVTCITIVTTSKDARHRGGEPSFSVSIGPRAQCTRDQSVITCGQRTMMHIIFPEMLHVLHVRAIPT